MDKAGLSAERCTWPTAITDDAGLAHTTTVNASWRNVDEQSYIASLVTALSCCSPTTYTKASTGFV